MLWTGASVVPGGFCQMSEALGDKAEVVLIRLVVA
jgi:hypothetical protein